MLDKNKIHNSLILLGIVFGGIMFLRYCVEAQVQETLHEHCIQHDQPNIRYFSDLKPPPTPAKES